MRKILVVEDDIDIQELLKIHLIEEGYQVSIAGDGNEGIKMFSSSTFDLILLDLMLPKLDGYGVCKLIREQSNVPIVILTALDSEENQIKGLDLLADDYITKPFSMAILKRKVANLFRRIGIEQVENETLNHGDLKLDLQGYKAFVHNIDCDLTPREFELLRELLHGKGRVFTRQNLLDSVWGYDYYGGDRIVDTHIKNLRKRLGIDIIKTIKGVGYRIDK